METIEQRRSRVRQYMREYRKTQHGQAYYHSYARSEKGKRKARNHELKRNYGLTYDEYELLLAQQGGGCAICGRGHEGRRRLAVDHDHTTGHIRGIVCAKHNIALAVLDSPELPKLVEYLKKHHHSIIKE